MYNTIFVHSYQGCKWAFTTKQKLKRHECRHTGRKDFCCPVENCGKSFTRKEHLQSHEVFHRGELPFECKEPGTVYSTGSVTPSHSSPPPPGRFCPSTKSHKNVRNGITTKYIIFVDALHYWHSSTWYFSPSPYPPPHPRKKKKNWAPKRVWIYIIALWSLVDLCDSILLKGYRFGLNVLLNCQHELIHQDIPLLEKWSIVREFSLKEAVHHDSP